MVEIEVPVKLYIKKFLEDKYGSPCPLTRKDETGKYFYRLLDKTTHERDKRINLSVYRHKVIIKLAERVVLRNGTYLSPTDICDWNNMMEDHIKSIARKFIRLAIKYKPSIQIKEAIEDFQREHGLSEENMTYELIKKDYFRHRKRTNGEFRIRKSVS